MNLAAVMDEIGDCVDQIPGLRVSRWPPGTVTPPAAVVSYPTDVAYYGQGATRAANTMTVPLAIALGRPNDRSTRDRLSAYLSGAGASAIVELVDAWAWQSCSSVTVTTADVDVVTIGKVEYLAALFTLEVIGQRAG